jgi:hypothetical protein
MLNLAEVLTADELQQCVTIMQTVPTGEINSTIVRRVLTRAVMERIEEQLGQEMDPSWLAYAIQFGLSRAR